MRPSSAAFSAFDSAICCSRTLPHCCPLRCISSCSSAPPFSCASPRPRFSILPAQGTAFVNATARSVESSCNWGSEKAVLVDSLAVGVDGLEQLDAGPNPISRMLSVTESSHATELSTGGVDGSCARGDKYCCCCDIPSPSRFRCDCCDCNSDGWCRDSN